MQALLKINLNNIRHNYTYGKHLSSGEKVFAVIKDNAYGLGARQIVSCLNDITDGFAVATVDEFLQIKDIQPRGDILVLMGTFTNQDLQIAIDNNLIITVATQEQAVALLDNSSNKSIKVFLKFDSGMSRLGFNESEVISVYTQLKKKKNITEITLMSHFCCADDNPEITQQQIQNFDNIKNELGIQTTSLSNSAGILYNYYNQTYARLGITLYGANPTNKTHDVRPVATLFAPIISIKIIAKGRSVGYGATYTCTKDSRIAIIKVGYGDGYPRSISKYTKVYINGKIAPIVGRVSMDMITINVTDVGCNIGDMVELFGEHIDINDVAASSSTISYEIFCSMNSRVERIYT